MVGFFSNVMLVPASLIKGVHMPLKSFKISFSATGLVRTQGDLCVKVIGSLQTNTLRSGQAWFDSNQVGQSET